MCEAEGASCADRDRLEKEGLDSCGEKGFEARTDSGGAGGPCPGSPAPPGPFSGGSGGPAECREARPRAAHQRPITLAAATDVMRGGREGWDFGRCRTGSIDWGRGPRSNDPATSNAVK